ncbi:hypothetical protein ZWY2020_051471 [Hordeum vulgare]|nr:hypothetical protein ZWY2020_051471 [Hordeum vulgare]
MRVTGGHALGEEAVAVVRQAVSLAARRGHAQVTPLHIARVMLSASAPAGILRAACVRSSHSHPLQPNALDLALGRLAVTRDGGDPAPSNAFVVTLKRAQAQPYRRTGGAGGKVGLEKLAVSVLDDPGVHRVVVRAAGFSSSQSQVRASVDASSEQSGRAGWNVAASSPNPFPYINLRAGRGQPSLPYGRYVLD